MTKTRSCPLAEEGPGELAVKLSQILNANVSGRSRSKWSSELGVSQAAISQWVQGSTLPRPELLRKIWQTVRMRDNTSQIMRGFVEMASKPAAEVSRHQARIGATVAEYITRPEFETLWNRLRVLPLDEQESCLSKAFELLDESRELIQHSVQQPSIPSEEYPSSRNTPAEARGHSSDQDCRLAILTSELIDSRISHDITRRIVSELLSVIANRLHSKDSYTFQSLATEVLKSLRRNPGFDDSFVRAVKPVICLYLLISDDFQLCTVTPQKTVIEVNDDYELADVLALLESRDFNITVKPTKLRPNLTRHQSIETLTAK